MSEKPYETRPGNIGKPVGKPDAPRTRRSSRQVAEDRRQQQEDAAAAEARKKELLQELALLETASSKQEEQANQPSVPPTHTTLTQGPDLDVDAPPAKVTGAKGRPRRKAAPKAVSTTSNQENKVSIE